MLDQIRANGEKKELVDEVVTLAKRYGITTPYTSYLVVPDGPLPVARAAAAGPGATPVVAFHLNLPKPGVAGKEAEKLSSPVPPALLPPSAIPSSASATSGGGTAYASKP